MNSAVIALIVFIISSLLSGYLGYDYGQSKAKSSEERDREVARIASAAAAASSAEAVSKIKVVNTTIKQGVEREVQTKTVYRDCGHTDDGLRKLNEALTGVHTPDVSGNGDVPTIDPPR